MAIFIDFQRSTSLIKPGLKSHCVTA